MTKTQYATKYAKCTDRELRKFTADRKLDITWTTRKEVIRAMRKADRAATFPFLELTPELRNMIYELVLGFEPVRWSNRVFCPPQILGASRQTYSEGIGYLYESDDRITLEITGYEFLRYMHISFNGDRHHGGRLVISEDRWTLKDGSLKWPPALLRLKKLHLIVNAREIRDNRIMQQNHALYDLSQHLLSREKAADITVSAITTLGKDPQTFANVLEPLSLMTGITDVVINGATALWTDALKNMILNQQSTASTESLCEKMRTLKQKTESDLEHARDRLRETSAALMFYSVNPSTSEKKIVNERMRGRFDKLTAARIALDNVGTFDGFIGVADHDRLAKALGEVEMALSDANEDRSE